MAEESEQAESPVPEVPAKTKRKIGRPSGIGNSATKAVGRGGLELSLEPAKEEVVMLVPPPKGGVLSFFRHKEYGLFVKETRKTPSLAQRFPKFLGQPEIEAMLADGFDDSKGYVFAEIDHAGEMRQVMWTKKQPKLAAPPGKPAWERLEEDVEEAVKPIESLGRTMTKLAEVVDSFRSGGSGAGDGEGTEENPEGDILAKGLEVQRKFYDNLFTTMSTSMGSAMTNMVMPWSIPTNFPQWAQMMMHPGFRQGLKETINETIEDLTSTVSDSIAGAAIRATSKSQQGEPELPSLSVLAEKAKKPVVVPEEKLEPAKPGKVKKVVVKKVKKLAVRKEKPEPLTPEEEAKPEEEVKTEEEEKPA